MKTVYKFYLNLTNCFRRFVINFSRRYVSIRIFFHFENILYCCWLFFRKLPPFKWIVSWLSTCFPGLAEGSKRRFNRGCLRYGDNSTTTETLTQSSKRSRLTSGTSVRQIVMFRVNSADNQINKNNAKMEVTVV